MSTRAVAAGLATIAALACVSACGGGRSQQVAGSTMPSPAASAATPTGTASPASTSNPYGAPSIDPPAPNEPILTVLGGSHPLSLTMDQLDALGNTTVTVDEPFVKKRQTFSGVPLAAVLAKAGVPDTATINTVALNSYHYSSTVRPMIASGAVIATRRDGAPIPYDQGGPIRIIFPDGTPLSAVLDAWNWSLASIDVTGPGSGAS